MTTANDSTADDKNCTDDRLAEDSDPLETFVDTPMDSHLRSECRTSVRGWSDHGYAAVSISIDIDAAAPLEVSLNADDARQLATELLTAAVRAEEHAAEWSTDE